MQIIETITQFVDKCGVDVVNWTNISKLPLSEDFIRKYAKSVNWHMLCMHHPLTLTLIHEFPENIDYSFVVQNKNLSESVRDNQVSYMDWEQFQRYQTLTATMLDKYFDELDPMIVLQYQVLSEPFINKLLAKYIETPALLKGLLDCTFECQNVSESFITFYLTLTTDTGAGVIPPTCAASNTCTADTGAGVIPPTCTASSSSTTESMPAASSATPQLMKQPLLVDLLLVVKYQTLSEEFIQTHCMVPLLRHFVFKHQKLSIDFLRQLNWATLHAEEMHTIALYQEMSVDQLKSYIPYDMLNKGIWNKLFIKRMTSASPVVNDLVELVNWPLMSRTLIEDSTALAYLIGNYTDKLNIYLFLTYNVVPEDVIQQNEHKFDAISWWRLMTTQRPLEMKFSKTFVNTYNHKQKWWHYISQTEQQNFYTRCINAATDDTVYYFLRDFAHDANWSNILRYEHLDEWFIRIFSQYADIIPMYWWKICRYQILTEQFIKENIQQMDLHILLGYQKLSIMFLEENAPFFTDSDWETLSTTQILTPDFCGRHAEHLSKK
jgi:hypothetical protein